METNLGRMLFTIGADSSQLRTETARANAMLRSIGQTAQQEGRAMDGMFSKLTTTLGGVFAVSQIKAFAEQVVRLRSEIQSLEISFRTLAGEAKGDALFAELRAFAVQTPMMLKDLAAGAQTMLGFNIEVEKVMPTLKAIGDISMGNAQRFNSLTLAFSQMSATGRLMGQDLLQMINAGFNPLSVIAEKTGKSMAQLKEEMEGGRISAQMVSEAFMSAASEGGKFHGMLAKQSQGLQGAMAKMQGAIDNKFNDIGQKGESTIVGLTNAATELAKNYERTGRIILALIATYGIYRTALMAATAAKGWATTAEALHYHWLLLVEKAQKMLNTTMLRNPYILVATLIASVVVALAAMKTETERVREAEESYEAQKQRTIEAEQQHRQEIDQLCDIAGDEAIATDTRREALYQLEKKYPDIFAKYDTEYTKLKNIKTIKQEIAALDGQSSITNSKNELASIEQQLAELDRLAKSIVKVKSFDAGKYERDLQQERGLTSDEQAKRTALLKKKSELTAKAHQGEVDKYFTNLTGISNQDLERQINTRKTLLAKMNMSGNKRGHIAGEGALLSGTYSREELQAQLQRLQAEQNYRNADVKSAKAWAEDKHKAYQKAERDYNDFINGKTAKKMRLAEFEAEAKRLKDLRDAAKKELNDYKQTGSAKRGGQNKQAQHAIELATRKRQIEESKQAQIKANRDAAIDVEQAEINLEKDSIQRKLKQISLDDKRMQYALSDRKEALLKQYRDIKALEWQNANPKAREKGLTFDPNSVTMEHMFAAAKEKGNAWLSDALAQIEASGRIMEQQTAKATEEAYKDILQDVLSYEQQRFEVQKQFSQKRAALYETDANGRPTNKLRKGVTQANVDELNRQSEEAIKAVDQQFAARSETYEAWCNEIATLSLKALESELQRAKTVLDNLEKDNQATPQALAEARAKVAKADDAVRKKRVQASERPDVRSLKEWQDLYKTLQDVEAQFKAIGEAAGASIGKVIASAGNVASSTLSVVNNIITLANWSTKATQMAAEGASKAIITIEKASVILAIISTAMQMAQTIIGLFDSDSTHQEEIDKLQERIDQLQWELNNKDAVRLQANTADAVALLRDTYKETLKEVQALNIAAKGATLWRKLWLDARNSAEAYAKTIHKLADYWANVSYAADKALGEQKYKDSRKHLENLAQQQVLLQQQINRENAKKKTDGKRVKEFERQITENAQAMAAVINEMMDNIIGATAENLSSELGNAFFEAAKAGEDAMQAWHNKVNDLVGDIMKRMLISKYLEPEMGKVFDKYKQRWFPDGKFAGIDAVQDTAQQLAGDLNNVGAVFNQIYSGLSESMKHVINATDNATRTASQKGIATASQESVDELNGRATAIQGHTFAINENTKLLVTTTNQILRSVMNIEHETHGFGARLERMEDSLQTMRDTLGDMNTKGIKTR